MGIQVRKSRTLPVTEVRLTPEEVEQLASLYKDGRYVALVNVMERACISLDTALINVPTGNPDEILGAHAISKAAWLLFTYFQKQVFNAYSVQSKDDEVSEAPTLEEVVQSLEGINYAEPTAPGE